MAQQHGNKYDRPARYACNTLDINLIDARDLMAGRRSNYKTIQIIKTMLIPSL